MADIVVKDLSPDDRPREKLLRHGAGALGDNELIAVVLGSGRRRTSALGVANDLLRAHGGLHGLLRSSASALSRVAGIGNAKAAQVLAAIELGRRTLTRAPAARVQFRSPQDAAAYLLPAFGSRAAEQFGVVLLDTRHRVMRTAIVATGGLNATIVEPRDIYREAMLGGAAAVVVFHNHPSGDPMPSPDDLALTRRLTAAGVLIGIDLVDHMILGDTRYFSFKEVGRL
jgi:DNA repair protein RadC